MSLKNPVTPPGIGPGTVRLVAQRLNHYATPGPFVVYIQGPFLSAVNDTAWGSTCVFARIWTASFNTESYWQSGFRKT